MKRFLYLLAVLTLVTGLDARAQFETRGVALLGTAGGGPAFVRDNDAILFNPANLVFADNGAKVALTLGNTYAFSGGDLFQFNHYAESFQSGRHLSAAEINQTLDAWFGTASANEQRSVGVFAEFVPIAFTFRGNDWAVGMALRARSYTSFGFNRGWLDLLLGGTAEDRTVALDGTYRTLATTDVSLAYSHRFGRLAVGVAPKLIFGTSYSRGELASTATVAADGLTHEYGYTVHAAGAFSRDIIEGINFFAADPFGDVTLSNPFGGVAGKGVGFDAGVTYSVSPRFQVAASLTDIGKIAWDGDAQVVSPMGTTFQFDGLVLDQTRIDEEFDGAFGDYARAVLDSLAHDAYAEVDRVREGFSTSLPGAFHLGTTFTTGPATFNLGTSMALNDTVGNLSRKPSFYAGTEVRLGPIPFRSGIRFGGDGAMTVGAGIGLQTKIFALGFGASFTPQSDMMGAGGRYAIGLSLANIYIH